MIYLISLPTINYYLYFSNYGTACKSVGLRQALVFRMLRN